MMKKFILPKVFLALFLLVIIANQSSAGGIPTVDVIAVSQRILRYAQEIQKFQEMLNQGSTMTQQYIQLVQTYQQKLREYQHYLNELKSLKNRIDNKDWLSIMRFIRLHGFYGRTRLAQVQAMDPDDSAYYEKLDEALGDFGYVPRRPEEVEADASTVGVWSEKLHRDAFIDWNNYERYREQMRNTSYNEKLYNEFGRKIEAHQDTADALGDEDNLATEQAIVKQGITQMDIEREKFRTLNSILFNMQQESARNAALRAEERDRELERLKNREPSQVLGRDTILP